MTRQLIKLCSLHAMHISHSSHQAGDVAQRPPSNKSTQLKTPKSDTLVIFSYVVLESGSVLESDSSTYFEDSDSDSDSDSSPLDSDSDSDSNRRTWFDSRCSGIGLSTVWLGINYLYFICYRYSMYRYMLFNFWDSYFTNTSLDCEWQLFDTLSDLDAWTRTRTRAHWTPTWTRTRTKWTRTRTRTKWTRLHHWLFSALKLAVYSACL